MPMPGELKAFVLGALIVGVGAFGLSQRPADVSTELEGMRLEYQAYLTCMELAGRLGCRMQPMDFVRFYELERLIKYYEQLPAGD